MKQYLEWINALNENRELRIKLMKEEKIITVKPEGEPVRIINDISCGVEPLYTAYYIRNRNITFYKKEK